MAVWVEVPSGCFSIKRSSWLCRPTGITSRPPGASCSMSDWGWAGAAPERMTSNGADPASPHKRRRSGSRCSYSPRQRAVRGRRWPAARESRFRKPVGTTRPGSPPGSLSPRRRRGRGFGRGPGKLGHQRHDIRLRNGLPKPDRQRMILVGLVPKVRRHEPLARHSAHDLQDPASVMSRLRSCSSTICRLAAS